MRNGYRLSIGILLAVVVLLLPRDCIPLAGLTVVEHRMVAILVLAGILWVLEPIPVFATSLLVILLELLLISDRGLRPLLRGAGSETFGRLLSHQSILGTFASPIIVLFLGGFFLAMAATKYRLDVNLARILLRPFGRNPRNVMLGLMFITALLSMFMSNTATTAMMLAILTPVLAGLEEKDPGRTAFVLAVPFAANIGGMGTPIGTPPNVVALKYLTGANAVGFGAWMAFSVPFVVILLLVTWLLLSRSFPVRTASLDVRIEGRFLSTWKAVTVYAVSAATLALWLTDFLHGMNAPVVAMLPVAIFAATRIITTEDLKRISWDVLWLVAGGIALGLGLEETGLSRRFIEALPLSSLPAPAILLIVTVTALFLSNLTSNTATANLLLPLIAVLGSALPSLQRMGGQKMLVLAVTLSCSLAMVLPISTPPNAMAHATGEVTTRQMARIGGAVGLLGLLTVYLLMWILKTVGFV